MPPQYRECDYSIRKIRRSYWEWTAYNGTGAAAKPIKSGSTTESEAHALDLIRNHIDRYLKTKQITL
ncbi:hypothetical protein GHA01_20220 [Novacetimonas hansenii]|uniref:Uncharacterized protein n=1 Tax=Novacetimonas hansenii TaxID=436 RepID=A0ABQ0SG01_NOVHA|nr:hypothetical protein Gaha_0105_003 [Novacetimonas hansenii JCM 7643]GEC64173.1 hypothetical protein GHA01_20220 [Novacetimonas hansenii]